MPVQVSIPEPLRHALIAQSPKCTDALSSLLGASESVESWFQPNLDDALRFEKSLVVLTRQALYAWDNSSGQWSRWELTPESGLRKVDRSGLGVLELFDDKGLIAHWRYTAAETNGAASIVSEFQKFDWLVIISP